MSEQATPATVSITPERLQELEDAERIAWALANTINARWHLPCLTVGDTLPPVQRNWHLAVGGKVVHFTVKDEEDRFILACNWPQLTPKARALIDAARRAAGATEERTKQ